MDNQNIDFEEDLKPLNLCIEFQETATRPQQKESPLLACLRSRGQGDPLSKSQHTRSTLGTASDHSHAYESDDESIGSIDLFGGELLDPLEDSCDLDAVDAALLISGDTLSGFDDPHDSFEEMREEDSCVQNSYLEQQSNFNDSMGSLNSAFEKLNACMERTAKSRELVKVFSQHSKQPLSKQESQRSLTRMGSQRSLLIRQDSNKSLSSLGNSSFRGPKSYQKVKGYRRHLRKDLERASSFRNLTGASPLSTGL